MKIGQQYLGKWIAAKNNKVIVSDKTLSALMRKVKDIKDSDQLKFSLIPKGHIAGGHFA